MKVLRFRSRLWKRVPTSRWQEEALWIVPKRTSLWHRMRSLLIFQPGMSIGSSHRIGSYRRKSVLKALKHQLQFLVVATVIYRAKKCSNRGLLRCLEEVAVAVGLNIVIERTWWQHRLILIRMILTTCTKTSSIRSLSRNMVINCWRSDVIRMMAFCWRQELTKVVDRTTANRLQLAILKCSSDRKMKAVLEEKLRIWPDLKTTKLTQIISTCRRSSKKNQT